MSNLVSFDTVDYRTGYFYDLNDKYVPYFQGESVEEVNESQPYCPTGTVFMVNEIDRVNQTGKSYQVYFEEETDDE